MTESVSLLNEKNNVFLIDWLTVVFHADTVDSIKSKLGLSGSDIPWESVQKFQNGYPMHERFSGITISYGADDVRFYADDADKKAEQKVRTDMGICVNFSGQGCRTFETYGIGNWHLLFESIFASDKHNITRLDLAYDDHSGILDIQRIRDDLEDEAFISKSRWWLIEYGTPGTTCYVGSPQSRVRIRIYDKAAERGFDDDRHWVRCELQLRDKRAYVAAAELLKQNHIGRVAAGILRNYLTFRVPTADSNKSRWPIAYYWSQLLLDMESISLWITPGEPYNFSKTEAWLVDQVGQALVTYFRIHRSFSKLKDACEARYKDLAPKYLRAIEEFEAMERKRIRVDDDGWYTYESSPEEVTAEMWRIFGFIDDPTDGSYLN